MSFHFKQFSITHQTTGLKVNTDGCLLGALSEYNNPKNCLDIGTGTGVIALMLAQKYPDAKITAIELNENAFVQAQLNIGSSDFKDQIELINGDILDYTTTLKFDLIVCNPPYFSKHLQGPDETKNMALHNDSLPQNSLIEKVQYLLSNKGLFWVIYPPAESNLFEALAIKNNLHVCNKFTIENKAGNHYRTINCYSKIKTGVRENLILLMDKDGKRTETFSKIMEPFYL